MFHINYFKQTLIALHSFDFDFVIDAVLLRLLRVAVRDYINTGSMKLTWKYFI